MTQNEEEFLADIQKMLDSCGVDMKAEEYIKTLVARKEMIKTIEIDPRMLRAELPYVDDTHLDDAILFFSRNGYKTWCQYDKEQPYSSRKKLVVERVVENT